MEVNKCDDSETVVLIHLQWHMQVQPPPEDVGWKSV